MTVQLDGGPLGSCRYDVSWPNKMRTGDLLVQWMSGPPDKWLRYRFMDDTVAGLPLFRFLRVEERVADDETGNSPQ